MARPAAPTPAPGPASRAGDRIAKLLARAGVASRREIERMIAEGRVALNGAVLDTPATVLSSLAGVTVDGNPVAAPEPARLFLYHKPPGLLVTERDPGGRPTIYDRLPPDLPRVVPVGRLDLSTEGLLLLTTDGGLKRQLELPASGVERVYRARCYGPISQGRLEELIHGIEIEGVRYGPINANLERRTGANTWIELVLTEGKNREVRRVLEYLGLEVSRLIRTRYGPFILADLPPGGIGEVRERDLDGFRHALAAKRPAGPERVSVAAPSAPPRSRETRPTRVASPRTDKDRAPPASGGTAFTRRLPADVASAPHPKPHPGARRGPVATKPEGSAAARPLQRGKPGTRDATQPSLHARRSGATPVTKKAQRPALRPTSPPARDGAAAHGPRDAQQAAKRDATAADTPTPRPAKIERKPGWARAKPKPGARPPRKR